MMIWFSHTSALLVACAISVIGLMYLLRPHAATQSFGLPLPEAGPNIGWWLRLKGVRDLVSGLLILALMMWSGSKELGIVLLVQALIPLGDMSLILAAKGRARVAFGVHGSTAVLMIFAALLLLLTAPQ